MEQGVAPAQGQDGSRITVNVPSVGRIPNGATIEREVASPFNQGDTITFGRQRPSRDACVRMYGFQTWPRLG